MSQVNIKQDGIRQEVSIDGQPVARCVSGLTVFMEPHSLPRVELQLVQLLGDMELANARVSLADLRLPEPVERALLAHLKAKYEVKLPVVCMGVDMATAVDTTTARHAVGGATSDTWSEPDPMEVVRAAHQAQYSVKGRELALPVKTPKQTDRKPKKAAREKR